MDITGQTLPCAIKVSGGNLPTGASYHSIAVTSFVANITPLTNLIVANLAGTDPADWFTGLTPQAIQSLTQTNLTNAINQVSTALGLSSALGNNNPMTTAFQAVSGDTLDDILEALANAGANYSDLLASAKSQGFNAPTGFNFANAYAALSGGTGTTTDSCATGSTAMAFAAGPVSGPYANGQQVCFTATSSTLVFSDKTLTNPAANTAVTAPYSAYSFTDGANVYEVIFNAGTLYEINLTVSGTFNGQFTPSAGTGSGTDSETEIGAGTSGNANLAIQVSVSGIVSSTIDIGNVPKPSSEADFCTAIQTDSNLTSIGTAAGGTLTINSCSYSGNVGNISATVSVTSPVALSIPYTVKYTYN